MIIGGGIKMKIEHVAIWTKDIERLKNFYMDFFDGTSGNQYINAEKQFKSYFIQFEAGARLEIMEMPTIPSNLNSTYDQYIGLIHIAISAGSVKKVNSLTDKLKNAGYMVVSAPRRTGDGYYESCVLDPDGNRIEITE